MGKVVVTEFVSLDGVFEDLDGSVGRERLGVRVRPRGRWGQVQARRSLNGPR
jgi:hypothetical protein